jgi:heme exporter protein B
MLLFVVSTLVVFHFTLPQGGSRLAAFGLLWVALVFTALLGLTRCFAAEREQDVLDGLVLAPSDRSAIWLGKAIATLAFLVAAEAVALPAFALFFDPGINGRTLVGVALAELLLPLLFLPLAIPIVIGGVGTSVAGGGRYIELLVLYDAIFAIICWASFEYVVTE